MCDEGKNGIRNRNKKERENARVKDDAYAIQAFGLTKKFGDLTAVNGVDLSIKGGSCFLCWVQTALERRPR